MPVSKKSAFSFSELLLNWNKKNNTRKMPWKGEKDPYKIWLSEIILQQTRVEQGLKYYENFINSFSDIKKLAKAPQEKVYKLWEGLGYYSRCKNLIETAKFIAAEKNGVFPTNYDEILALKGVGVYTAAAIASFAYNLPYAVVDGNVFRVLSRIYGINTPVDTTEGKKLFSTLAQKELDKKQPGLYNQAIMDFGAVVCKPATPLCVQCPFNKHCVAFNTNTINDLPVKEKKISIKNRYFYYIILNDGNTIAIRQRTAKDIWQNLYEFPLFETAKPITTATIKKQLKATVFLNDTDLKNIIITEPFVQKLSHQTIHARFIILNVKTKQAISLPVQWVSKKQLSRYSFPRIINEFFTQKPAGTGF